MRVKAGDLFPDYEVMTSKSDKTTIQEIAKGKPLMMIVLRYIGCPSCRYDVHLLNLNYEKFVEKGVNIAVVMQSSVEMIKKTVDIPFPIICDPDYKIYNDLEIMPAKDMQELMGSEEFVAKLMEKGKEIEKAGFAHGEFEGIEEQLPAFFYLNTDLTVKVAHYGTALCDMPTVQEMLDM